MLNALYNQLQFWIGRAVTLEQQAGLPIVNPVEMGQPNLDSAVARIAVIPEYRASFIRVFARQPNPTDLVRAIASYERSQLSFELPHSIATSGGTQTLSVPPQAGGWVLFRTKGRCNLCHMFADTTTRPTRFTDDAFHNIGVMASCATASFHLARRGRAVHRQGRHPSRSTSPR